jgi:hypothetical protein
MSIFCFGLSHQTAAVDVRERFAIPESALPEASARAEEDAKAYRGPHSLKLQSNGILSDRNRNSQEVLVTKHVWKHSFFFAVSASFSL